MSSVIKKTRFSGNKESSERCNYQNDHGILFYLGKVRVLMGGGGLEYFRIFWRKEVVGLPLPGVD